MDVRGELVDGGDRAGNTPERGGWSEGAERQAAEKLHAERLENLQSKCDEIIRDRERVLIEELEAKIKAHKHKYTSELARTQDALRVRE